MLITLLSATHQHEASVITIMSFLKHDLFGYYELGGVGEMRSFDNDRNIIDAVDMFPSQIKELLDTRPWTQGKENKFCRIDRRKVIDYQALFCPPDEFRPPKRTKQEIEKLRRDYDEYNRKLLVRIAQEEREGVDVEENMLATKLSVIMTWVRKTMPR